ncbi:MAG: S9 family peptidase [Alphaproteobacteria bacterium]|nr:S9 family peptidase [Alphaproteobacteria bacterium]
MRHAVWLCLFAGLFGLSACGESAAPDVEAPLIPRADLFGNPERTSPAISPDGSLLAWLAPKDGVLNIWVARADDIGAARAVTEDRQRGIRTFGWTPGGDSLFYLQDQGGDENYRLHLVDPVTAQTRDLTPVDGTRVQLVGMSYDHPDAVLIGLNDRDPRWHDIYRLDLGTGERTLVRQMDGYAGAVADDALNLRLAIRPRADGGLVVERIASDGSLEPAAEIGPEDALSSQPIGYDRAGTTLYWLDSRERDTAALIAEDTQTGERSVIGESARADVQALLTDPVSGRALAYGVDYLTLDWVPIADSVKADFAFLEDRLDGTITITSQTRDGSVWVIANDPTTAPPAYYLYRRATRDLTPLFTTRPALEGAPLQPMHAVEIPARDGLTLVSYLTLPPGSDPDGDGRPEDPVPMVMNVHGGPWARDSFGYDAEHQWLANRGYAVLSVNYRGSTGFGKRFLNAGNLEWGRKMHEDLIDALGWAESEGITAPERTAIYGGSYGGYAALVGLAFTPKAFACGVDIVGPSNLETLLASIPPYWAASFEQFATRVGDPRTEEGRALLRDRSPLTRADEIMRPLLIAQGANDPRVKQAESDQIVAAMRANERPVTYVLYPEEGHGFAEPANRTSFYAIAEGFLGGCLGGRFQPVGEDFAGARFDVVEGAAHVPGLEEALAARP